MISLCLHSGWELWSNCRAAVAVPIHPSWSQIQQEQEGSTACIQRPLHPEIDPEGKTGCCCVHPGAVCARRLPHLEIVQGNHQCSINTQDYSVQRKYRDSGALLHVNMGLASPKKVQSQQSTSEPAGTTSLCGVSCLLLHMHIGWPFLDKVWTNKV